MIDARMYACAICGEANADPSQWFLVTENYWEDKLKILEWNSALACEYGIHLACSPSHVQELVVHWMATGSVHYPFAQTTVWTDSHLWNESLKTRPVVNTQGVRIIGELTVHRESMRRVLKEKPGSLKSILDALDGALKKVDASARKETAVPFEGMAQEI